MFAGQSPYFLFSLVTSPSIHTEIFMRCSHLKAWHNSRRVASQESSEASLKKWRSSSYVNAWLGRMEGQGRAGPSGAIGPLRPGTWTIPGGWGCGGGSSRPQEETGLAAEVQTPAASRQKRALKTFYCGLKILHCRRAQLLFLQPTSFPSRRQNLVTLGWPLPQMPWLTLGKRSGRKQIWSLRDRAPWSAWIIY